MLARRGFLPSGWAAAGTGVADLSFVFGVTIATASPIYYDRILRLEPGNASAWYSRGLVFYDQQATDKALESFSRAYDAGMRDAFLSHVLVYLYDNTGNTSRAIGYYKEALEMDSSRADIYARLAELEPSNASRYKKLAERWGN